MLEFPLERRYVFHLLVSTVCQKRRSLRRLLGFKEGSYFLLDVGSSVRGRLLPVSAASCRVFENAEILNIVVGGRFYVFAVRL